VLPKQFRDSRWRVDKLELTASRGWLDRYRLSAAVEVGHGFQPTAGCSDREPGTPVADRLFTSLGRCSIALDPLYYVVPHLDCLSIRSFCHWGRGPLGGGVRAKELTG